MSAFVAPIFPLPSPTSIDASTMEAVDRAAQALYQNGLCATAEALFERLAEQPGADPVYQHRAALAREAHRADAAARVALQSGLVPLPSAQRTATGAPRFVAMLPEDALLDAATEQRFAAELAGDGVDAELRHFLDEALEPDAAFIDFAPAEGLAALSALTAPKASGHVVVRQQDGAYADALRASATLLSATARLTIATEDTVVDQLAATIAPTWLHVRAGAAADVPAIMAGAISATTTGRLASVLWPLPAGGAPMTPGDTTAATVLSVLGFQHFVVGMGPEGIALEPFDGTPRGHALLVSLSPAFVAAHAERA